MLPRCTLAASTPVNGRNNHYRSRHANDDAIKHRLDRWSANEIGCLWSDVVSANRSTHELSTQAAMIGRCKQAMENGQYSKAAHILTSDGLVPASQEAYDDMLAKHPQCPAQPSIDCSSSQLSSDCCVISPSSVALAVNSFPNGTGPGPSGLHAAHIKEGITCPSPTIRATLLEVLTDFINLLCQGKVPSEVTPHLCGALLLATRKKHGGLRPIAVGEVLRRLASKCVVQYTHQSAVDYLSPLQLGVGVSGGAESIVHAVRSVLLDDSVPSQDKFVLQLDFSNAFNTISRPHIFESIRSHLPSISAWVELCYQASPVLHFGDHIIRSVCGVQQGDPLGPLGFAMALHPLIQQIHNDVPGLLINSWYLDDGVLCGPYDDLMKTLDIIESAGPPCGLSLNRSKCLLITPADTSIPNPPSDIPITGEGFSLLGAPIGPPSFCNQYVMNKVNKVSEISSSLSSLQDLQMAVTFLRSSWSFSKMSYLIRTTPSTFISDALEAFDAKVRETFSDLLSISIPDWSWLKATLPCSMGGLNLRLAALHSPAAYLSSVHSCSDLISKIIRTPSISCFHPLSIHLFNWWLKGLLVHIGSLLMTSKFLSFSASFPLLLMKSPFQR